MSVGVVVQERRRGEGKRGVAVKIAEPANGPRPTATLESSMICTVGTIHVPAFSCIRTRM